MTSLSRRGFIGAGGLALAGASMISGRAQAASLPEAPTMTEAACSRRSIRRAAPTIGRSSHSTVGRCRGAERRLEEFHLVAEPVVPSSRPA